MSCVTYLIDSDGRLLVDSDGNFLVVLGAGLTNESELPWKGMPTDAVARQTLTWRTDISKARDGSEQRRCLSDRPRMTLGYTLRLNAEEQRQYRAMLKSDTDAPWKVPLWHDPLRTTGDATVGGNSVAGSFTNSDIQVGQLIFIESGHGFLRNGEFATAATVSAGSITITGAWSNDYPAGALVYPAVNAQIRPGAAWTRNAMGNIADVPLDLLVTDLWPTGGSGASVATYQGEPLLDRTPIVRAPVNESADRGAQIYEDGGLVETVTGRDFADLAVDHMYLAQSRSELQWWRAFGDTVRGQWKRFYASTWRSDLELYQQPGGGANNLIVLDCPSFNTRWFTHGVVDLQLETSQGVLQRRVTSVVDNGGTQTLALNSSLPGGSLTVTKVSFLELCRLATDSITFSHVDTHSTVQLALRTLPTETDGALSTWSDYDKSIQDAEPIDLFEFTGPSASYTYRYCNYSRTVSHGGDDYSSLAGGVAYTGDVTEKDLDADDFEIEMPVSAGLIQDYIREPNRGISVIITRVHGDGGPGRVIFRGTMASIATDGDRATVLVSPGLGDPIRKVIPSLRYSPNCQNRLGDGVCGIDLELSAHKFSVTASVVSGVSVTVSAHGQVDGFFDGGKLVDTSGESRRIVKQVGTSLQLSYPLRDLEASDSVTIYAGCTKVVEAACRDKFSNVNGGFLGVPFAPSKDVMRRGLSSLKKEAP